MSEPTVTNSTVGTTGAVSTPTVEKKIAIVGFTASREKAPWGDPSFEIWICNNLWKFCPDKWQRMYDLHEVEGTQSDPEHEGFLRGNKQKMADGNTTSLGDRQVWVFRPQSEWPTAQEFPRDAVTDKLGRYFTNSISWMIAHALMEGVTELGVYGVDMATGGEYAAQRPSCEYMLGIARGMGIEVHLPKESDLLKLSALYGAEDDSALHAKMLERKKELTGRLQQAQGQRGQLDEMIAKLTGALETTNYVLDVWTNPRATSRHQEAKEASSGQPEPSPNSKPNLEGVPA